MEEIKGYQIIYVLEDSLLLYKNFGVYRFQKETKKIDYLCSFLVDGKKRLLCACRLANRLFRLSPRCCERLSETLFVVSLVNKVWVVDTEKKNISEINVQREGFSTPLNLCKANDKVYWGDYGANSAYGSVNIYSLNQELQMEVVYTFAENTVRHIHNIVFDEANNRFWIFTGDNEKRAGIYIASTNWKEIVPFKTGEQKYRAVVGFPYKDGIIYATDSVERENFLYLIDKEGVEKKLMSINGSVIYGGVSKNKYLFSTTVESSENKGLFAYLSTELGGGIKNRNVELLAVDKNSVEIECIARYEKDVWPMKLLQYGVINIPCGQEDNTNLWFLPVACKKVGGQNVLIKNL